MKAFTSSVLVLFLAASCGGPGQQPGHPGEELARKYCGSCHLFPEPALLDKDAWKNKVLPPMATFLGIDYLYQLPLDKTDTNAIDASDWQKIVNYYVDAAPEKMPLQHRAPVNNFTNQFRAKKIMLQEENYPATSFVMIDPGNHWVIAAGAFDSTLTIYNEHLDPINSQKIHGVIVDMDFKNPIHQPGERVGIMTDIGIMNPTDLSTGSVNNFRITTRGKLTLESLLFDSLPRPVATRYFLNNNGAENYLVAGFGNATTGALIQFSKPDGITEKKILRNFPGAIKMVADDFNGDHLQDIMVLMAQAEEGIFLLTNNGKGGFDTKQLLRFPPVYGSSYFELCDFNNDGKKDILYTCGDNADYTSGKLKNYHGVYIFINEGNDQYNRKYFYPVHGCFKAVARDFDLDGDLDIATISYFPDIANQPAESFVYLEQKSPFQFETSTIKAYNEGKWLTMDAGDIDGDGDDDIVLGSLVPPQPGQQQKWKTSKLQKCAILLLRNNKNLPGN